MAEFGLPLFKDFVEVYFVRLLDSSMGLGFLSCFFGFLFFLLGDYFWIDLVLILELFLGFFDLGLGFLFVVGIELVFCKNDQFLKFTYPNRHRRCSFS